LYGTLPERRWQGREAEKKGQEGQEEKEVNLGDARPENVEQLRRLGKVLRGEVPTQPKP
jgi:hypothetical protein